MSGPAASEGGMFPDGDGEGGEDAEDGEEGSPADEEDQGKNSEDEEDDDENPFAKKSARQPAIDPTYRGHYNRGWKARDLEAGDLRNEPSPWYDGYYDAAAGREKFHSYHCRQAGGCEEHQWGHREALYKVAVRKGWPIGSRLDRHFTTPVEQGGHGWDDEKLARLPGAWRQERHDRAHGLGAILFDTEELPGAPGHEHWHPDDIQAGAPSMQRYRKTASAEFYPELWDEDLEQHLSEDHEMDPEPGEDIERTHDALHRSNAGHDHSRRVRGPSRWESRQASLFFTASGNVLDADDMINYLALRHADDRPVALAAVQEFNRQRRG